MTKDQHGRPAKAPARRHLACWLLAAACLSAYAAPDPATGGAAAPAAGAQQVFARVGEVVVTREQFEAAFVQAARGKFYHGKAPDGAVAALQREVGQGIVDDILIAAEAQRRGIAPDHESVKRTLDSYDERYRGNAQWGANRERILPALKARLERDSILEAFRKEVRTVGDPTEAELVAYWEAHQDKFTAPEQVKLSVILLGVVPSSPQAKWDEARAEGAAMLQRLREGADFQELARQHSSDSSAANGGDMGYQHKGMLPEPAQLALDKLEPGAVSEPVVLLEGVAIFRLDERRPARLNPLDVVRTRARDLWKRDRGEEAWTQLLARLRSETPATIDDSGFLPLTTSATADEKAAPR